MNPLTPEGLRVKELLEKHKAYKCFECGGKLINGDRGFYVCSECGLEHYKIMSSSNNPYNENNESLRHKYTRELKAHKKQIAKEHRSSELSSQQVWKDVHVTVKKYCKEKRYKMKDFCSIVLKNAVQEGYEL